MAMHQETPNVFCVRALYGQYANAFKSGNYVAIGWLPERDLTQVSLEAISQLHEWYKVAYPGDADMRRAQNVGQIARFLFDVNEGDIVLTPSMDTEMLYVGDVGGPYYRDVADDCPFPHRRRVRWRDELFRRSSCSVPLQHTLASSLTVFKVSQVAEVLAALGRHPAPAAVERNLTELVLDRILELSAQEFEQLVTDLLASLGFEASHTGRTGDAGIDVTGKLRVYGLANVNLTIQVKRYIRTAAIGPKHIRDFRGAVPNDSEAAFITTARFNKKARDEAEKPNFKRVGLIDGSQLVDILLDHYQNLGEELRGKLRLRRALVPE